MFIAEFIFLKFCTTLMLNKFTLQTVPSLSDLRPYRSNTADGIVDLIVALHH